VILKERRRLIDLSYRMIGSLTEAEDVVQETFARWCTMSPSEQEVIESPAAWLTTVASRICLNHLGSARARRERYVGEWLPEPLPDRAEWLSGSFERMTDPADQITLDESVTMSFLVILETMTPAERVAFVLHDVFRYPFGEVAEIVGRTPQACRQLATSARRRLTRARPLPAQSTRHTQLVREFKQAWEARDIDALIGMLDPDAVAVADGGGLATTFLLPIEGAKQVARFWIDLADRATNDMALLERTVNGQPGLVVLHHGDTATVLAFNVVDDVIKNIWVFRNPDKLGGWTRS
jgi:RNA polymerase sigma-70 factor (ECF subfamily)